MDSSGEFRFEVPILNSKITAHEVPIVYAPDGQSKQRNVKHVPDKNEAMEDNDCTIIENIVSVSPVNKTLNHVPNNDQSDEAMEDNDCKIIESVNSDDLNIHNSNVGCQSVNSNPQNNDTVKDKRTTIIENGNLKEPVENFDKTVNYRPVNEIVIEAKNSGVSNINENEIPNTKLITNDNFDDNAHRIKDNRNATVSIQNADSMKDNNTTNNPLASVYNVTVISNNNTKVIGVENIVNLNENDVIMSESVNNQIMEKSSCTANITVNADVPNVNKPNEQAENKDIFPAVVISCNQQKLENSGTKSMNEPAPIIIDEDSEIDNDSTIIDLENSPHKVVPKNPNPKAYRDSVHSFDELQKQNRLLTELIEMCLDMENSTGMLRIINRTLIPIYKNADNAYIESVQFTKALSNTIIKLDSDPDRKFSHLKELCELLKSAKVKKRVTLTTLQKEFSGRPKKKRTLFSSNTPEKKKRIDTICLDDDEDDIVQTTCNNNTDIQINDVSDQTTEDKSLSVQLNKDCEKHVEISDSDGQVNDNPSGDKDQDNEDVILIDDKKYSSDNANKENNTIVCNSNERNEFVSAAVLNEKGKEKVSLNNNIDTIDLCTEDETMNSSKVIKPGEPPCIVTVPERTIEVIENEIATFVALIKALEEREVIHDNQDSPYVLCDSYKAKVVSLYKEICKLTGSEPVKKHTVRMKPEKGHHEGPIKFFEMFINSNFDEEGNTVFPDLVDVINCVHAANFEYKLGWNKKQIQAEARALFVHYGRTVQKRRQHREWRHLLRYFKQEAPDPADEDPNLQARLVENCKIAKKNEEELLARFADMEKCGASNIELSLPNPDITISNEQDDDDSDSERTLPTHFFPNFPTETPDNCGNIDRIPLQTENLDNGVLLLRKNQANCENTNRVSLKSYEELRSSGSITDNIIIYNPWSVPVQVIATDNIANDVNLILSSMRNNFSALLNTEASKGIEPIQHNNVNSSSFEFFGTHKPQTGLNSNKAVNTNSIQSTSNSEASIPKSVHVEHVVENLIDNNEDKSNTELNESNEIELKTNLDAYSTETKIEDADENNAIFEEMSSNLDAYSIKIEIEDLDITENNISSNSNGILDEVTTNLEPSSTNIKIETENMAVNVEANSSNGIKTKYSTKIKFEDTNEISATNNTEEKLSCDHNNEDKTDSNKCQHNINEESLQIDSSALLVKQEPLIPPILENNEGSQNYSDKLDQHSNNEEASQAASGLLVKQEPLDIPRMLEQLGDDFTATIIDIEDPFMVIEISDSSESEDEGD